MPGVTKLTIAFVGSTSSGLEPTSARPQGCRPCPGPEPPHIHGLGGGAALPRAGAFRPSLAARGSLSLPLLGIRCWAPSLCGPRVNPISRGEAPVTPGLPHPPRLSPPLHWASRASGPGVGTPARGPSGVPAPGHSRGCQRVGAPGRAAMAGGSAARVPGPPRAGRTRVGAEARVQAAAARSAP